MSSDFEKKPFSESHLDSPEYRMRLMRKLNTLIAVLEVASAKVRRSLVSPDADTDRLDRIHKNLKDTLGVCLRAKKALERCEKLPDGLPASLTRDVAHDVPADASGAENLGPRRTEMTSREEERRFKKLGPIESQELRAVDIDDLCRKLQG
jgi:hypothetical protein